MEQCLTLQEEQRRRELSEHARDVVTNTFSVEDADDTSLMLSYDGFYLQIAFSQMHPLMVFYLARSLDRASTQKDWRQINELNLKSVLGSHALNDQIGCYAYRSAHWLDTEISKPRFLEMLGRCVDEAKRGYMSLTQ